MSFQPCNNENYSQYPNQLELPLVDSGAQQFYDPMMKSADLSHKKIILHPQAHFHSNLAWFFHEKLDELSEQLKLQEICIDTILIQGSSVDRLRKHINIPLSSDVDVQLMLKRSDNQPISGNINLIKSIDRTIKKIFAQQLKSLKKINVALPFANYKIFPIDLSIYFEDVNKVDCTSSHDGRKIVVYPFGNKYCRLELMQSNFVNEYCSFEEACDLFDRKQFRVSDQHALDVGKDALLIYLRNEIQLGLIYVNENHHSLDPMRLYRFCAEKFFQAYASHEKNTHEMGLADKLKGFIDAHFNNDTPTMYRYLEKLTHIITIFSLTQNLDRKQAGIHLLNNIGNYAKRQRKFKSEEMEGLESLVDAEIKAINEAIRYEKHFDAGGRASFAEPAHPSHSPVQLLPKPMPFDEACCALRSELEQSNTVLDLRSFEKEKERDGDVNLTPIAEPVVIPEASLGPEVEIADSKVEEKDDDPRKKHPKVLDEKPLYLLKNIIDEYRAILDRDIFERSNYFIKSLEDPGSILFEDDDFVSLEQELVLLLTEFQKKKISCLQLVIAFLMFQPDSMSEKVCKVIADQFAISFLKENNNDDESGMKYEIYQTYFMLSESQKETVIQMLCLSADCDLKSLSKKKATQLLAWIVKDCRNISKELKNKALNISKMAEEKKRDKWVHAIVSKYEKSQEIVAPPILDLPKAPISASSPIQVQASKPLKENRQDEIQENQEDLVILKEMQQEMENLILEQNWIKALKSHNAIKKKLEVNHAISVNRRKKIERKLKHQLDRVEYGFKSFLSDLFKQPCSAPVIIHHIQEYIAEENSQDLQIYQILIFSYAEMGNYPLALAYLIKTLQLKVQNMHNSDAGKIKLLGNMVMLIQYSIQTSNTWQQPLKSLIFDIVADLRKHPFTGTKRKFYPFERTLQKIKDCMALYHPQQNNFNLDERTVLSLSNFFIESLPQESLLLSERVLSRNGIDEDLVQLINHGIPDEHYAVLVNTATYLHGNQDFVQALECYKTALSRHITAPILLMCCRLAKGLNAHASFLKFYRSIDKEFNQFDFFSNCPEILEINLSMGEMFDSLFNENGVMQDYCWSIVFNTQALFCDEKYHLITKPFARFILCSKIYYKIHGIKNKFNVLGLRSPLLSLTPSIQEITTTLRLSRIVNDFSIEKLNSIQASIIDLRPIILNETTLLRFTEEYILSEKRSHKMVSCTITALFITTIAVGVVGVTTMRSYL